MLPKLFSCVLLATDAVSHGMFLLPWASGMKHAEKDFVTITDIPIKPSPSIQQPSQDVQTAAMTDSKKRKLEGGHLPHPSPAQRGLLVDGAGHMRHIDAGIVIAPSPVQQRDKHNHHELSTQLAQQNIASTDWQQPIPDSVNREQSVVSNSSLPTMTPLQQTIEAQFSLEILLKHRELRLIEQELAKCQVSLEQLRRCEIVPYPAMSSKAKDLQAVSGGSGSAFLPEGFAQHGRYPPPWGVTDGPYTRHYAKWLLPDPLFGDVVANDTPTIRGVTEGLSDRPNRGTKAENIPSTSKAGKSRSQRGSTTTRLHALPPGYPEAREAKELKGPVIVKRPTDGHMVKLVCLDCRRSNFNSTQGFINHCRIQHSRGFASHEAAVIACGEEVDVNEIGTGLGDSNTKAETTAGLVHPLIRSALSLQPISIGPMKMSSSRTSSTRDISVNQLSYSREGHSSSSQPMSRLPTASKLGYSPFQPSAKTPYLSALLAKLGSGGNLDELVTEAKIKVSMDSVSDDEEEDLEMTEVEQPKSPERLGRPGFYQRAQLSSRATMSPAPLERIPSRKGIDDRTQKPQHLNGLVSRSSHPGFINQPLHTSAQVMDNTAIAMPDTSTSSLFNLSPNTIESNNAPSLISDDDLDERMRSESEAPSSRAPDDDDEEIDFEVEDHDESIGLGSSRTAADLTLHASGKGQHARRAQSMRQEGMERREESGERHVSFASPVRRRKRCKP